MYGYEELSLAAREALHAEVTAFEWSVAYAKKKGGHLIPYGLMPDSAVKRAEGIADRF